MKGKSIRKALAQYLPDKRVLDERPPFDDDLSKPLFHKGNEIGCITLHGIGGTPANVRVLADALIDCGYTVVSPTLPGHGETVRALAAATGEEWLDCVRGAYQRLINEGCTQIYALGLSLGGILSGLLAEEAPLSGLALICAPIEMRPFLHTARRLSAFLPVIRYPEETDSHTGWGGNPYEQMYDGLPLKKLSDLNELCRKLRASLNKITCPTLFVSAEYDDKVDPAGVDIWKAGAVNVPETEYLHLANSLHGCTYGRERDKVAQAAIDFVRRCAEQRQNG